MLGDIAVHQLHAGDGDGADVVSVSIFPSNGMSTKDTQHLEPNERPLPDHLIDLLARAVMCDGDAEYEEAEDHALNEILDAGKPLFAQLVSSQPALSHGYSSLYSLLFPEILYFRLVAPEDHVSLVPIRSDEAYTALTIDPSLDGGFEEELDIDGKLPRHDCKNITVIDVFSRGVSSVTAAVRFDGQEMFCKSTGRPSGLSGSSEGLELEHLGKILGVFPQPSVLRVPRLLGYVLHEETDRILGFLRQWVPGCRLSDIDLTTISPQRKRKWTSQIRESMQALHKQGIAWGDCTTGNIIIDGQSDAWLVDFEEGFSANSTDDETADRIESDVQAFGRIVTLLI
ncbi:hypothetical protein F5X68DRAFT_224104 [Plectosphaerella plurivora]|uniref:Protein kinase domain-containing protein n=1 Tax=Plectosphaerella plurivora TaxID=936078 RepID=A0A9P8V5Z1_9PEZI|nr:hypothetical protein F5X68DRAFT_224104 [Plectosphaerella plurivora]